MNHLLRAKAPISDAGWKLLDDEARERLTPALAARKLVDFSGPHGWEYSATNLGRVAPLASAPADGVSGLQRRVLPLVELRADFELSRAELRDGDRGADDVDLEAARPRRPPDRGGRERRRVPWLGRARSRGSPRLRRTSRWRSAVPDHYPRPVAGAVEQLLRNGIAGPYGLALGREQYRRVVETAEHGGYPLLEHLRKILEGPIVWAPGVKGAVVVSQRGGDFLFESGEDLSIGYDSHDARDRCACTSRRASASTSRRRRPRSCSPPERAEPNCQASRRPSRTAIGRR